MSYLIYNDYKKQIQTLNLQQILGSDLSILNAWQLAAQEKVVSYLTQKYEVEAELTDTNIWDGTIAYQSGNRVYLDAPAYNPQTNYTAGIAVTYQGAYFVCTGDTTGIFDGTKWTVKGPQYTIFYAAYPAQPFNINGSYNTGDKVFYQGKVYTALQPSAIYDHAYVEQVAVYQNIPQANYFPGTVGYNQWDGGVAYLLPAGTDILNAQYWVEADNRSQELLMLMINMVLYYAYQRISPQNIPALRASAYNEALQWLSNAAQGAITPNLPKRQPDQGSRIRFGGNVRNINSY